MTKIPTQVQTAWVGGTTPLPRPFAVEVTAASPPAGLSPALAGLWWDAKGDWTRAHESAQAQPLISTLALRLSSAEPAIERTRDGSQETAFGLE